jgi:hypothetical protein
MLGRPEDLLHERKLMNLHKGFALSLAVVTLLGLTAVGANAETVTGGSFTLPVQAYWGNTLLPAGDYTLSLDRELSGIDMVFVRGEGISAMIMAPAGAAGMSTCSCLKVDEISGTYVIREFDAGTNGRAYNFPATKAVRKIALSGSVTRPANIPVSAAAGF